MKKLVHSRLIATTAITNLVPAGSIIQRYALGEMDIADMPDRPFIVLGELPASSPDGLPHETSSALSHFIQIYVHDEQGSFEQIETILDLCRPVMLGCEGLVSPSTRKCLEARFQTRSEDAVDEAYRTFVKHDTYQLTGSTRPS